MSSPTIPRRSLHPRTRWPVPDQPGVGASLVAARLPPPEPSLHPASDRRLPVGPQIREQSQASYLQHSRQ